MCGLSLLGRARQAGLEVRADGDLLLISGPKRYEGLGRALLAAKAEVLAELELESWLTTAFPGAQVETREPAVEATFFPADFKIRRPEDVGGDAGLPPTRCWSCANSRWWRLPGPTSLARPWVCAVCHPPAAANPEWFEGVS